MNITTRELLPDDDLNAVLALCRDFFAEYERHHGDFFETADLTDADISGKFIQSLESNSSATFVALVDDTIVGYVSLVIREQAGFYKVKRVGAIPALMVAKEYRRMGIATRLMGEAKDWFRDKGIKYYTFYTSIANQDAIRLYEQLGIEPLQTVFLGET